MGIRPWDADGETHDKLAGKEVLGAGVQRANPSTEAARTQSFNDDLDLRTSVQRCIRRFGRVCKADQR